MFFRFFYIILNSPNKYSKDVVMEYLTSQSVPFEIADINHGFQLAKGILKIRKDHLELEFEVQDAILGVISSGVQTVSILFDDLEDIRYEKGWFGAKIILKATSMKALEDLPGSEQATAELKIKRKNRKEAESVVSSARVALSEHKLDGLDD